MKKISVAVSYDMTHDSARTPPDLHGIVLIWSWHGQQAGGAECLYTKVQHSN